jgi:hypothetical protein
MGRLILFIILIPFLVSAQNQLIQESLDDQAWDLTSYGHTFVVDGPNNPTGYCAKYDHADLWTAGIVIYNDLTAYLDDGVYFRYWIKYDSNYEYPSDVGEYENVKIWKIACPEWATDGNIEYIFNGDNSTKIYWLDEAQANQQEYPYNASGRAKNVWHKIETYIKIPSTGTGNSTIHLQIDDYDVWNSSTMSIRKPYSNYYGTKQIHSVRASNSPPATKGFFYLDDFSVFYGNDLCDAEPALPTTDYTDTQAPTATIELGYGVEDSTYYIYNISADLDTGKVYFDQNNTPTTLIKTFLTNANWDTTVTLVQGWNWFKTYMVDDSSNSVNELDSIYYSAPAVDYGGTKLLLKSIVKE